ncbi:hypothetical protein [Paenibacillus terrae]|nr:hypothetical protein [Paenibacillus terrae]
MDDKIKRVFATTFVQLILSGRSVINDVPVALQEIVQTDLNIAKIEKE